MPVFLFYFPLGKGNTGSSSLFYFIINLKGKQITFKIPFLLTKNERVMNNIKTRNNIIKRNCIKIYFRNYNRNTMVHWLHLHLNSVIEILK